MNSRLRKTLIVVVSIGLIPIGARSDDTGAKPDPLKAAAKKFIEHLANAQFAEAEHEFDETMKEALPEAKLRQTWTTVVGQVGKLKEQGESHVTKVGAYDVVGVTCRFERAALDIEISFDRDRRIAGLYFRPTKPAPRPHDPRTSAELKTATGTLYGTFDLPTGDGPFPVVVIIAGSGPTDRDGNQPLMKNDSLKRLGVGLAAQGIAALRYDKRAIGESWAAGPKEEDLRFETYVADVVAWIQRVRQDKRFSRVGIIGHSEGSLIGMLAAKQAKVDSFVSIAGSGRIAAELLREQIGKNLPVPELVQAANKIIDELAAGRTVADVPLPLMSVFRPSVQPYAISQFKYDPAKEIAALDSPIMIVQGTTDIQVTVDDAERLARANQNARLVVVDGMNHMLKYTTASTRAEQLAAYTDPSLPLAPKLLDELTVFLNESLKG